jgi:hypothetical protein
MLALVGRLRDPDDVLVDDSSDVLLSAEELEPNADIGAFKLRWRNGGEEICHFRTDSERQCILDRIEMALPDGFEPTFLP